MQWGGGSILPLHLPSQADTCLWNMYARFQGQGDSPASAGAAVYRLLCMESFDASLCYFWLQGLLAEYLADDLWVYSGI